MPVATLLARFAGPLRFSRFGDRCGTRAARSNSPHFNLETSVEREKAVQVIDVHRNLEKGVITRG